MTEHHIAAPTRESGPERQIAADFDDFDDDEQCWNCGGERFVYDCCEEYACVDPQSGCEFCMRRCDVCNLRKPVAPG